ncbi:PTS transporter subunit IIA-like nitrogen-regulatory protein PtsN [Clostridium sartagoforme AAU1]|uniref:PTS transporter subunit IIA-like nitrogen-regulatory protein PtsN n=1 Tax=Clostridium sartagoforme AAU1 TaxID=1202534 RepID=R9CE01_9CLOT|nr:PTS sugar transporter subunit IIA [Clostridium sartagoforme]EOR27527.1 PTS transporter subunit IIA-like nitrogen-regulatory protein PtsN [Clostridium sartagoforme AAU1]
MAQFIDLDTIFVNVEAKDKNSLLELLGDKLYAEGYVNEEYKTAVIKREENFPTGLNVEGEIKVAIPHADIIYVNKPGIAFASLKEPINFNSMDDPEEEISIKLVFMLAVKDPNNHVVILQKLMEVLQNQEILSKLESCSSEEEVKDILNKEFN